MESNKQRREEGMRELKRAIASRDRKEKTQPIAVAAASLAVIGLTVGGIYWATTHESNKGEDIQAETTAASSEATPDTPSYPPLATARSTELPETVTCSYEDSPADAARDVTRPATDNVPARGTVTITLDTSQGPIGMQLDRSVSPCTVNALEHLAKEGYYNDTICHRLTTSGIHVLQCGDPTGTGTGGPGFMYANEYPTDELGDNPDKEPVNYGRGTIAMANSGPNTNGSQFFLNYSDSPLPPDYTYVGQIDENGLSTLDKIAEDGIDGPGGDGKPATEVKITAASVN